jgi:bifunctional non-homologous end joining protein LigD
MLNQYHNKRNFSKTPEPDGNMTEQFKSDAHGSHRPLRFVVQKHDASRLHYDFRLETEEGVLKSWAVPKGISLDPKVKRLAILTEDHPLGYLLFEGIIPEGNYGAGTVIVWDTGTYNTSKEGHKERISDQFNKGKIVFNLLGHKLRGRFSLVKTSIERENQWLLIKGNDEFASDEDLTISRPESVLTKMTNNELVLESESNKKQQKKESKAKDKMTTRAARISSIHLQSKGARERKNKSDLELSDLPVSGFPTKIKPMLAMPVDKPFNSESWVFEIKWDGVRSILFFNRTKSILEMLSRSGNSITLRYPELISHIRSAVKCNNSAVIDGEIVILNREGIPDFQSHQTRMNVNDNKEIANLSAEIPGTYYLFDILYLDGKNLQNLDYLERRKILSKVIETNSRVRISDYFEGKYGIDIFDAAKRMNLEGIIAKNKFGKYLQGTRSRDWLKIKNIRTQDCVVIGYTRGEGNREAYFGSLLLAVYNNVCSSDDGTNGSKLRFVGHTGSGFNFDQLDKIYNKLKQMKIEKCPVDYIPYTNRDPTWVRPEIVAEIKLNHWTNEGIMRAPIFLRFREDKRPKECVIMSEKHIDDVVPSGNDAKEEYEQLVQQPFELMPRYSRTTTTTPDTGTAVEEQKLSSSPLFKFSNLGKVYWDKTSEHPEFTKRNLLDYYDKISVYILHYLKDRPISLSRYPDGIKGKHFYHKHWDQKKPEYVKTVQVYSESRNDKINYLVCNNKETLLWIANLGCIEMHPWYSRVNDFSACKEGSLLVEDKCGLDFPDFIVFDLDPYIYLGTESKGAEPEYNVKGFKAAIDVAYCLKELFDQLKIKSYVKTSGKTGLHIFVPIKSSYSFSLTRKFAETIGKMLLTKYPQKITMEWDTHKRKGKVFFDHNQNARGKTIASIFSVRPTISATVSMPLRWKELESIVPTDFTILNVHEVIRKTGDAWKDILDQKQDLLEILETMK